MARVSNCGHDENWRYSGGTAGDQTGNEWYVRDWYDFGQNVVLRHPDAKVRALVSQLAREAAENDLVGYDQSQRDTFWQQLCKVGYRPSKIATRCEADCSSGVAAIVKAVGYLTGDSRLKAVSPSLYTGNERSILAGAGFQVLTASKYLRGDGCLLPGDVNLNERTHTNIVVGDGSGSGAAGNGSSDKLKVDGWFGALSVAAWQRALGTTADGVVSGQSWLDWASTPRLVACERTSWATGSELVRAVQRRVGAEADGLMGASTVLALQRWLNARGASLSADGVLGARTAGAVQRSINAGRWS